MKLISFKNALLTMLTLAAVSIPLAGYADGPYAGSLGAGNAAYSPTDVWRLICPAGTASVRARARAVNPNGNPVDEIATTIHAANGRARTVISVEGLAAPTAVLTGAAGVYFVSIHKDSELLAARYILTLDCYRSTGAAIAGTQTAFMQNQ